MFEINWKNEIKTMDVKLLVDRSPSIYIIIKYSHYFKILKNFIAYEVTKSHQNWWLHLWSF